MPAKKVHLLIVDDIFPYLLSAFRVEEYNAYLERLPDAQVYSTTTSYSFIPGTPSFEQVKADYVVHYPHLAARVRRWDLASPPEADVAYTIFLNNACSFVDYFDSHRMPFSFTLYPGGGFQLDDPTSDTKLRRVFKSPNFREVIVTQRVTRDYLLDRCFCPAEAIAYIYGGVNPTPPQELPARERFGEGRDTLDICFVAFKYSPMGRDKGYDVFIEAARQISARAQEARFHVVGTFSPADIEIAALGDRIRFYGPQPRSFFPDFYRQMDIILSPNRPFVLAPGAFDGFPTAACVDAGLAGTALFCADELKLNESLEPGHNIVIVQPNADLCAEAILDFRARPRDLAAIGENGSKALRRLFSFEAQMEPRLAVLSRLLAM